MEQSEADAVRARITPTLDYGDLAESDLVVEAITEDLRRKLDMWAEVDRLVTPGAFLAPRRCRSSSRRSRPHARTGSSACTSPTRCR
jgi:3-hydroxyacyl-CoA dehydrogenase